MTGCELYQKMISIDALRRMLNRTSAEHSVMIVFDYAGASVAAGGGTDEAACEMGMKVDETMVRDLLDLVECDPETFAEIYDEGLLRMLLGLCVEE